MRCGSPALRSGVASIALAFLTELDGHPTTSSRLARHAGARIAPLSGTF